LIIEKEKGDDHISNHKCLVEWNDISKTKSWVNYFALSLSDTKPIDSFARNNNLLDKMPFCHLTQYFSSNTVVDIARKYWVSASPEGIECKFRIKVEVLETSRMQLIQIKRMETNYDKKP
jgi:uncharacterized membrane protein